MKIAVPAIAKARLLVLIGFASLCATVFGYLWVHSGGTLPMVTSAGYRVSLTMPQVSNLVDHSDVRIAGVKVGTVASRRVAGGRAELTLQFDNYRPLHEGAQVKIRQKTLVNETFVEVVDGQGQPLPDGSTLPTGSGHTSVEVDDVLRSLDPNTRNALATSIRSLGSATDGTAISVSDALGGLGELGSQGKDVFDALAAQSADLKAITGHTATLLAALNTRQGEIVSLVSSANVLASTTASDESGIRSIMTKLPGVLDATNTASSSLARLSAALDPVAANLRAAAPDLSTALTTLPAESAALRSIVPTLDSVLGRAPTTLTRVPAVAADISELAPPLEEDLLQLNPMLSYLNPYGPDIAHMFVNWAAVLNRGDAQGKWFRMMPVPNPQSVTGLPVSTNVGSLASRNPYPSPGALSGRLSPFRDSYPHVQKEVPPK